MTTVAIIPARAGSKRVRNKNASPCAGLPLMAWTCYAAKHATALDRVIVSTEDESIAHIARRCGVGVLDRPAHLATDEASTESVMAHVFESVTDWSHAVLLQPTSPLRTAKHIDEAVAILLGDPALDTVIGVYRDPGAYFTWTPSREGRIVPEFASRPRTQDIDILRESGALYCFSRASWEKHGNRLGTHCAPYVLPHHAAIDIDDYDDLRVAEYWLQAQLFRRNDEFRRHLDAWCGGEGT